MNHEQVREQLGADPAGRTPELEAHLAGCAECAAHARGLLEFDARLKRALAVPVPPAPAAGAARRSHPRLPTWFALAASGVVAALALGLVLALFPRAGLAGAVVAHVEGEPDSWATTETVTDATLERVLTRSGVRLDPGGPRVTYAQSCTFRGHVVPHLIVQTEGGPMTVMVLAHEHVARATPIDEGGFRGVIVPSGAHAIAVLARGPGSDALPAAVAADAARAFHFVD